MKDQSRSRRTFALSLAASLAVHVVFLSEFAGWLPAPLEDAPVLTAELRSIESPPPARVPPSPSDKHAAAVVPKPMRAPQRQAPPPPPLSSPAQSANSAIASVPYDPPAADSAEQSVPETAANEPEALASAAGDSAASAPPAQSTETAPEPKLPHSGTITYELFYGTDKLSIGRSVQTWSIDKTSYRLTSFSETTGIVGLFRPYQYAYVSEGSIGSSGFRPQSFSVRRGRGGERQAIARFDWEKGELTFGPLESPSKVPLQAGTYDFLSFIYQLARSALSPGRRQLMITTGTKLNTYVLEVGVEENLQLPLGTVRAIPVKQIRAPGEESVQVWLAADGPQLPVKIRFLDREGRMSVEQLAQKIDIDEA